MSLNNFFYDFPCLLPRETRNEVFQVGNDLFQIDNSLNGMRPNNRHINNTNADLIFPSLQLSRHHVIPMNLFLNFFTILNNLGTGSMYNQYRRVINTNIESIASLYNDYGNSDTINYYSVSSSGTNGGGIASRETMTRSFLNIVNLNQQSGSTTRVNVDYQLDNQVIFSTLVAWMPGNIFLGPHPEERSDDPGSNFEQNSQNIIGPERYRLLFELHQNMINFENNQSVELLERIFNAMISLCKLSVVPFDSHKWKKDEKTNKFRIDITVKKQFMRKKRQNDFIEKPLYLKRNKREIGNLKENAKIFCDPMYVLLVINEISNNLAQNNSNNNNRKPTQENCKEDTGFWAGLQRIIAGPKCNRIIHDELRK